MQRRTKPKPTAPRGSKRPLQLNLFGLTLVFATPMLGGFLYGFDIGATSFVLAMLMNPPVLPTDTMASSSSSSLGAVWWTNFSSLQQGLFVSGLSLGGLIGSHLVLMYLSHRVGRRMELRVCSIFYILGAVCNVTSGTILRESTATLGFAILLLGRILYGIGVGFVMHGAPAYLAEMCPTEIRGAVVSAKETVIVFGVVVGYTVGNVVSADPSRWTDLYAVAGLVAVPMLAFTYCIPRSKRWLLLHGLDDEAYESMKFVYRGDIRDEFDHLVDQVSVARPLGAAAMVSLHASGVDEHGSGQQVPALPPQSATPPSLFDPRYRKAIFASMGLVVFQQLSGQPSVLSYATVLFQAAGWSGGASVVSSILMMVTSMSAVLLIERLGRKALLGASCVVMMVALSALSTAFWGWDADVGVDSGSSQRYVILAGMFLYIGGYQLGFGPITWCVVSEVFPLEIRGTAIALGVELNYALNFAVQFSFPILQSRLGWGPSFTLFGVVLAFAFCYIQLFVPETTGLTLEEIQLKLAGSGGSDDGDDDDDDYNHHHHHRHDMMSMMDDGGGGHNEGTPLLTRWTRRSASMLGGALNLEEMETQLVRTHSGSALTLEKEVLRI